MGSLNVPSPFKICTSHSTFREGKYMGEVAD